MADLQAFVVNDDALDDELQERLFVGGRSVVQPVLDPRTKRRQARHHRLSLGALFAQAALLLALKVEGFALIVQLPAPLLQFLQTDHLRLISVEQTPVRTRQPVEACPQLPLGVGSTRRGLTGLVGEFPELGEQLFGIAEQSADMVRQVEDDASEYARLSGDSGTDEFRPVEREDFNELRNGRRRFGVVEPMDRIAAGAKVG